MAGFITPLPVMLELDEEDRKVYEALKPPKSIVVRYGYQKMVAELPYSGGSTPGCGSKLVVRTQRGVELGEMLTTTCENSGCSKSVSRKDMLKYIENSGGKDYPFTDQGRILRVAETADLNEQTRLDGRKPEILKLSRQLVGELELDMKPVDVEPLLGGERIIIYYTAEQWVDFRELVKKLAGELQTRIEMHQVNDREEARLVADYERCGQYCCCKNFLKVLKPVSMRSAKVQKATLDPQKISGRCGRLMCCLRYEDQTYETLRKKLPHRKTLVETEDGIGLVWGSQILTQLVLVKIGPSPAQAYPLENIRPLDKQECAEFRKQEKEKEERAFSRQSGRDDRGPGGPGGSDRSSGGRPARDKRPRKPARDKPADADPSADPGGPPQQNGTDQSQVDSPRDAQGDGASSKDERPVEGGDAPKRKRRRRRRGRRRKPGQDGGSPGPGGDSGGGGDGGGGGSPGGEG
jgi:cell fate regulator YaaT (PSP1 superfamily)